MPAATRKGPSYVPDSSIAPAIQLTQQNEKLIQSCLELGVHTAAFDGWATAEDFLGKRNHWKNNADGSGHAPWIHFLAGMNIGIANLTVETSNGGITWPLDAKLISEAERECFFELDKHTGSGKYNWYACTSMICLRCKAKKVIQHRGLPEKKGYPAPASLIQFVNEEIVKFFFTNEEISRHNLLSRTFCTVERLQRLRNKCQVQQY